MPTRFIATFVFSLALYGQGGFSLTGEVRGNSGNGLEVQLYDPQNHTVVGHTFIANDGGFQLNHVSPGWYAVRVKDPMGSDAIVEEFRQVDAASSPIILQIPERIGREAAAGTVSVEQLRHPPVKRAVELTREAQRLSQASDIPHAIERLEEAVRIDPYFTAAHINLGAQYARSRRPAEALVEFEKALALGSPTALLYTNLAWAHLARGQISEAEVCAKKALAMEPGNSRAQMILDQMGRAAAH